METSNLLSWTFVYDFIRGPMVWAAFFIFVLGTLVQIIRIRSLIREHEIARLTPGPGRFIKSKPKGNQKRDWGMWLKLSIAGVNPFMVFVTTIFHVLLVIMPLLVLGHNILLDNAFGLSMVSLPEKLTDFMTLAVILCCAVFLFRRLFLERVKIITSASDYLFLGIAAAPFVTGFLAYHQVFENYRLVISLHILSGEVMLMAVPFTKFIHMIYFVIVRFTVAGEYALGKGNGRW